MGMPIKYVMVHGRELRRMGLVVVCDVGRGPLFDTRRGNLVRKRCYLKGRKIKMDVL